MRQVQAAAHNIQLVLQAERTEYYYETFNTPAVLNDLSFTGGDSYRTILSNAGIVISAPSNLTDIQWGGIFGPVGNTTDHPNTTLTKFMYTNGKYFIIYTIDDGFSAPKEGTGP